MCRVVQKTRVLGFECRTRCRGTWSAHMLSAVKKTMLLWFECSMGEKCGVMVYEVGI